MSRSRSSIEADISRVKAKIREYEGIKEDLYRYRDTLEGYRANLNDRIITPVNNYDFTGEGEWAGFNEKAVEIQGDTVRKLLATYDGEVGCLLSDINEALEKIQDMIDDLEDELDDLEDELDALDDDDDDDDDEEHWGPPKEDD